MLRKKWLLSMIEEFKKDISNKAKIDFFSSICFRDKNVVENLVEQYIWEIDFLYICSKDIFFVFFFSALKNFASKLIIYVLIRIESFLMFSNDMVPLAWCAKGEAHSFQWCEGKCFLKNGFIPWLKNFPNDAKISFFSLTCFKLKNIVQNLLEQYIWERPRSFFLIG